MLINRIQTFITVIGFKMLAFLKFVDDLHLCFLLDYKIKKYAKNSRIMPTALVYI